MEKKSKEIILTGDRPTGPLHLGHYVGSLLNRLRLQDLYKQYVMIADIQALTDNFDNPQKVTENTFEVMCDYLAVGINPEKTSIFLQSQIHEIAELTILYMNLVTLARLKRNPTVKTEIAQKNFKEDVPVGFIAYPISQAADITFVKATMVPVGADQLPMIEQTNEIVRTFNRLYNQDILKEVQAIIPETSRLPGLDGKAKMSKSLGNAIYLKDSANEISAKVKKMYTDPNHLKIEDPGSIEGNIVFTYLDIFDTDKEEVARLKEHYQKGGLADSIVKKRLTEVLENLIKPIRERREQLHKNKDFVFDILKTGTMQTREVAAQTKKEVFNAIGLNAW